MTKHVANEHPCFRIGQRQNAEKIATDLLSRLVPMTEAQPAFLRSQTSWETRIILREKYLLNVARHFKIGIELSVLQAQLLSVADKFLFRPRARFFRSFTTADILHHSFVV